MKNTVKITNKNINILNHSSYNPTYNPSGATIDPTNNPSIDPTKYPPFQPTLSPSKTPTYQHQKHLHYHHRIIQLHNLRIQQKQNPLSPSISPTSQTKNPTKSCTFNPIYFNIMIYILQIVHL
eukprot:531385_1